MAIIFCIGMDSHAQSNNVRAFYLTDIDIWLGNTVEENKRLSYAANNGFNYIIFYDLHLLDFNNVTVKNNIASFFSRARNNYGISQLGAAGETYNSFANKIVPYNNSRSNPAERFNVLNLEFEFWVSSSITQYYCSSYLTPNGYSCDTAGAFAYSYKMFKRIDSLCAANGLISELYVGWPNQGQMGKLADVADRILVHSYQSTDAGLYSYARTRLMYAASINKPVTILPLFSSESSFLGPWLQSNPIYKPYQTYCNAYIAETGTWKQYINLQGYTWFYYPTMPQTTSGTASVTATGSTIRCLGDSVTLTASAGVKYLWSPGGATTQSITVNQTGNYLVNVMQANGASVTSAPVSVNIGANQTPVVVNASGPTSFCDGDSVTLTCTTPGPYLWSSGQTTSAIVVKDPGNYSVSVQTGGCTATSSTFNISVSPLPAVPVVTPSGPTDICAGNDVTLSTTSTGNLLWSNGATTNSIVVNSAGTFSVKDIGGPGCFSESSPTTVNVLQSLPAPAVSLSGPADFCDGDSVVITCTSAGPYLWSDGSTASSITVKQSGSFYVSSQLGNCTSSSAPVNVNVLPYPAVPVVTSSGPVDFCSGSDVTLSTTSAGDLLWSTGATSSSIVVNTSGSYSVKAMNGSCYSESIPTQVNVLPSPPLPIVTASGSLDFCDGDSVILSNNTAGPYLWSNGSTESSITVKQNGSFYLSLSLGNCTTTSVPVNVNVTPLPAIPVVTSSGPTAICPGTDVTLSTSATGDLLWSTGATTNSIVVNSAGSYWVRSSNSPQCFTESAATPVTIIPTPPDPVISSSGSATFCDGDSITLTSTTADDYLWSNGATTQSIVVKESGSFSVQVTDGDCNSVLSSLATAVHVIKATPEILFEGSNTFCEGDSVKLLSSITADAYIWSDGSTTSSIYVSQPDTLQLTVETGGCSFDSDSAGVHETDTIPIPVITLSGPATLCPGESVTLTSSFGDAYLWSDGTTSSSITVSQAGNYSVAIQSGTCMAISDPVTVTTNPPPAPPVITANGPLTFCSGNSVTLSSSAADSYLWSNGETTSSIVVTQSGDYSVVIQSSGCSATSSITTVTVDSPLPVPVISADGPLTFCSGESVTLTATSSPGYSYLWSDGSTSSSITVTQTGNYSVTIQSGSCSASSVPAVVTVNNTPSVPVITPDGPLTFCGGNSVTLTSSPSGSYLWSNGATTSSINVTQSGNYSVTVLDAGCSSTSSITTVTADTPLQVPVINASGPLTFCAGGSVTLSVPTSPSYSYLWSDGSTTSSITVSQTGNYSVTIQSGTCSAISGIAAITVNNPPAIPSITPDGPLTFCSGNFVTLTSSPADSYLWSNGATTSSIVVTLSGDYSVTGTTGGCSVTSSATTVTVHAALAVPTITASGPLTFCSGGSVTLTCSAAPNYTWSNGATTQSITVDTTSTNFVNVHQGTCNNVSPSISVVVNPLPAKPVITSSGSTSLCTGQSVTLTSSATSGNLWSNNATTVSITVSSAGNYTVKQTLNGCSNTSDPSFVTVTSIPSRPTISASGSLRICPGTAVTLTSSATTGNLWSNGATTRSIVVSSAGGYWVKRSVNGCFSSQSSTSTVSMKTAATKPTVSVYSGSLNLASSSSSVTLRSSSATSYLWSNNTTSRNVTIRSAGVYRVTVTNSSGCTATSNDVKVTSSSCNPPNAPVITLSGSNVIVQGQSVTLTSSLANGYLWSNGATTQSITVSAAGTYTVRAYSSGSCYSTSLPTRIYVVIPRLSNELAVTEEKDIDFKAYPNPARENITFSFYSQEEQKCVIRLYDLSGRETDLLTYDAVIGMNIFELNISDYKKGLYFAYLLMGEKSKALKLIFE